MVVLIEARRLKILLKCSALLSRIGASGQCFLSLMSDALSDFQGASGLRSSDIFEHVVKSLGVMHDSIFLYLINLGTKPGIWNACSLVCIVL